MAGSPPLPESRSEQGRPRPPASLAFAIWALAVGVLALGAAAVALTLVLSTQTALRTGPGEGRPAERTARAEIRGITWRVEARGVLEYGAAVPVVAEAGGRLEAWAVAAGGRVAPGDILARVADPDGDLAVEAARLRLERAELGYARLLAGPAAASDWVAREAHLRLAQAELALARLRAQVAGLEVAAPAAGRLAEVAGGPGPPVAPGQVLAWVEPEGPSRVVFPLEQYWLARVAPGAATRVIAPAPGGPRVLEATVAAVAPELRPVPGSAAAEVTLEVHGPAIVPGLAVHVVLQIGEESVQAGGTVAPPRRIPVRAAAAGTLAEWVAAPGGSVEAGAVVARLASPDLALALRAAERARDAAAEAVAALAAPAAPDPALERAALAVAAARAAVTAAQAAAESSIRWAGVPGPGAATGILVEQQVKPGEPVAPGQVLGLVAPGGGAPLVVVEVEPALYHAVAPGAEATVRFAALPEAEVPGVVAEREPYRVRVRADLGALGEAGADLELPPGSGAQVAIHVATLEGVLAVPVDAVDRRGPTAAVWVIRDGAAVPVAVALGPSDGRWVRISTLPVPGRINPGEPVLLVGDGP